MQTFSSSKKVITRIAPSPTGRMHIGTVRTALFNYLFAKKHGGEYFVRIEDTDKERNDPRYEEAIWKDFEWCGLIPDKKFRQSDLLPRHVAAIKKLLKNNRAYISQEPSQKDPKETVEVVRLRNPGERIVFSDLIHGEVSFDTTELKDFVIARSVTDPLYHLAVVVDDAEAGVTHVLRAEEHISNTPRQILIQAALDYTRPEYAHLPLILAPDRSKLSKRKHHAGIDFFREAGYLPEAIINYLALLGWNPGSDREIFSLDELVAEFDLTRVQKAGAIFDTEKLNWFNRHYLRERADLVRHIMAEAGLGERGERILPLVLERATTLSDVGRLFEKGGEFDFVERVEVKKEMLPWRKSTPEAAKGHIEKATAILRNIPDNEFHQESIKAALMPYAESAGKGDALWPVRVALSGKEKSPDPFSLIAVLGKVESVERLQRAATLLS